MTFTLSPRDLSLIDDGGKRILEPGEFTVTVGGKQPGFKGTADTVTTGVVSGSFVVTGQKTAIP